MDNLMRDKFIELVHDLLWDDEDPQRANMIINCADEYAESMKPQWISVSEELPEVDKKVLVSYDKFVWTDWRDGNKNWFFSNSFEGTAWMPLPELYQEGGK